jgi:carboxyl-terminal processing protease
MTGPARLSRVHIFCRVLVLSLCLVSFVVVALVETRSLSAQPHGAASEDKHLSAKTRKEVFETIWRDIHDHYYDPGFNGVNWDEIHTKYFPLVNAAMDDADFYALMSAMTGELHDAHTRFSSPSQWRHYKRQQGVSAGFSIDEVEGKAVVASVRPDSSAAHAGIETGMIVRTIDGNPIEDRIAEIESSRPASSSARATRILAYGKLLSGPQDSTLKVGLQRADGTTFEAIVTRQVFSLAPQVYDEVRPSGAAYIRFDEFQPSITKPFKQALERFRNAPAMIIDLRRNGGGDLSVLLTIAGYFFDKKTLFAKDSTRSGKPLTEFVGILHLSLELYVGRSGDQIYSGPVVILVGPRSASSSEVFAAGMQETQRAKIVGSPTCGCVLGIAKPRVMKGGGVLEISEVLWFSPKGRKLEGVGIVPDQAVVPTMADLQHKRDPVEAEAERVLRQMLAAERHSPRS